MFPDPFESSPNSYTKTGNGVRVGSSNKNARAIAGGLLIAVAVLLGYSGLRDAQRRETTSFVVATRDIAPGELIDSKSLKEVKAPSSDLLSANFVSSVEQLENTVYAKQFISSGKPILTSQLGQQRPLTSVQLSIPADPSWSLTDQLRPGDYVDVYVTDTSSPGNPTIIATVGALLLGIDTNSNSIESSRTLRLQVQDQSTAIEVISAARSGKATIARTPILELRTQPKSETQTFEKQKSSEENRSTLAENNSDE